MKKLTLAFLILEILACFAVAAAETQLKDTLGMPGIFGESGVYLGINPTADTLISISDALGLAISRNPLVGAARARVIAAQGRLQQSGYRPNPEFSAEVEDFGRSEKSSPAQTTLGIEQPFELFGKRGARQAVAEAELSAERYLSQQPLFELYQAVTIAFVTALGAEADVSLTRERLELSRKIEEAVGTKVADGAVPKAELLRAQSTTKLAEIELSTAEATAAQQRLALASLWGSAESGFRVDGSLDDWLISESISSQEFQIEDNPELASLREQVRARNAEIRLAKATGKPDVNLGAGYRRLHDDGSNAFLVWAAIPLPLFNRNQGGIAEAVARLSQSEAELASTRQRIEGEIRQLLVLAKAQRKQVSVLREQVIPPAQEAMEAIDFAYRIGSQPYINVLDAQRSLTELQSVLIDALVAGALATTELELLIGHRLNPVRR